MKLSRPNHATVVAYTALVVAMSGTAYAATGGTFVLGRSNAETTASYLSNANGTPLALVAKSGTPPLAVSNPVKVSHLNADLLDGLDSPAFQRRIGASCSSRSFMTGVSVAGTPACAAPGPWKVISTLNAADTTEPAGVVQPDSNGPFTLASTRFTLATPEFVFLTGTAALSETSDASCDGGAAVATVSWSLDTDPFGGGIASGSMQTTPDLPPGFNTTSIPAYLGAGTHTASIFYTATRCNTSSTGTATLSAMHAQVMTLGS